MKITPKICSAVLPFLVSAAFAGSWSTGRTVLYTKYKHDGTGMTVEIKATNGVTDSIYVYRTYANGATEDRGKTIMSLAMSAKMSGETVYFENTGVDNGQNLFLNLSIGSGY